MEKVRKISFPSLPTPFHVWRGQKYLNLLSKGNIYFSSLSSPIFKHNSAVTSVFLSLTLTLLMLVAVFLIFFLILEFYRAGGYAYLTRCCTRQWTFFFCLCRLFKSMRMGRGVWLGSYLKCMNISHAFLPSNWNRYHVLLSYHNSPVVTFYCKFFFSFRRAKPLEMYVARLDNAEEWLQDSLKNLFLYYFTVLH